MPQRRDSLRDLIARRSDAQAASGNTGSSAGLGKQGGEDVDPGLCIHFHFVSITARAHTHTMQGQQRLFQSQL